MERALIDEVRGRYIPRHLYVLWPAANTETSAERFARAVALRWEKAAEEIMEQFGAGADQDLLHGNAREAAAAPGDEGASGPGEPPRPGRRRPPRRAQAQPPAGIPGLLPHPGIESTPPRNERARDRRRGEAQAAEGFEGERWPAQTSPIPIGETSLPASLRAADGSGRRGRGARTAPGEWRSPEAGSEAHPEGLHPPRKRGGGGAAGAAGSARHGSQRRGEETLGAEGRSRGRPGGRPPAVAPGHHQHQRAGEAHAAGREAGGEPPPWQARREAETGELLASEALWRARRQRDDALKEWGATQF